MSTPSRPVYAEYPSHNFVSAAGVAIFHLATARVVLCYHTRDKYWFLPKGRRDAGESYTRAAEREGFEESGFRNRLLPLPVQHRQPRAHGQTSDTSHTNVIEPVWTSLLPNSRRTQYLLHWYISETLPPADEERIGPPPPPAAAPTITSSSVEGGLYQEPPAYPADLVIKDRIAMEDKGYEPVRYENTGVDAEEALYRSEVVPVEEAMTRLGKNCMSEVVAIGWERIQARRRHEEEKSASGG